VNHPVAVGAKKRKVAQFGRLTRRQLGYGDGMMALNVTVAKLPINSPKVKAASLTRQLTMNFDGVFLSASDDPSISLPHFVKSEEDTSLRSLFLRFLKVAADSFHNMTEPLRIVSKLIPHDFVELSPPR
jgi:hypothetical protein